MHKLFFTLCCLFGCSVLPQCTEPSPPSQQTATVDERIELSSIACRLAGYKNCDWSLNKSYVADIQKHFDPYKNHPLIEYLRQLGTENSVGYSNIAQAALYLEQPPRLKPATPFSDRIPEEWWGKARAEEFAGLLRQFYEDAHCEEFFDAQRERYSQAEKTYNEGLKGIDTAWFGLYYGIKSEDTFRIIIGLGNGGSCYGPTVERPDQAREVFSIMGAWKFDGAGNPVFSQEMLETVVHEFNHSFVNPYIDRHEPELREAARRIFDRVAPQMRRQSYSMPTIILYESLVRASTIRYLVNHGSTKEAYDLTHAEISNGFLWVPLFVKLLEKYEAQRDVYPTMESFTPDIVRFFDEGVAGQIDRWPRIVSIEEFENEERQVDPALKTLTIHFDQPIISKKVGFHTGRSGTEHFPIKKLEGFSDDNRTITLQIDLKPDWEYQVYMPGYKFISQDGWPIKDTMIYFKTRPAKQQ